MSENQGEKIAKAQELMGRVKGIAEHLQRLRDPKYRVELFVGGISLLLTLAILVFWTVPTAKELFLLHSEVKAKERLIAKGKRRIKELEKLAKETRALEGEKKKVGASLFVGKGAPSAAKELEKIFKQFARAESGLRVRRYNLKETKEWKGYHLFTIDVSFEGTVKHLVDLLEALENKDARLRIATLKVRSYNNALRKTATSSRLRIDMTIEGLAE